MLTLADTAFPKLSPEELVQLSHLAERRTYADGEIIFKVGDEDNTSAFKYSGLLEEDRRRNRSCKRCRILLNSIATLLRRTSNPPRAHGRPAALASSGSRRIAVRQQRPGAFLSVLVHREGSKGPERRQVGQLRRQAACAARQSQRLFVQRAGRRGRVCLSRRARR